MSQFHVYHSRDCELNTNVMQPPRLITGVETYASLLIAARKAAKLTQTQLAKKAGVSQGTVGNIESGERKSPASESIAKLAHALGVPVDRLTPGRNASSRIATSPPIDVGSHDLSQSVSATTPVRYPVIKWGRLGVDLLAVKESVQAEEFLPVPAEASPLCKWTRVEADHPRLRIMKGDLIALEPVMPGAKLIPLKVYLFQHEDGSVFLAEYRPLAGGAFEALPDSGPPMDRDRHGIKPIARKCGTWE